MDRYTVFYNEGESSTTAYIGAVEKEKATNNIASDIASNIELHLNTLCNERGLSTKIDVTATSAVVGFFIYVDLLIRVGDKIFKTERESTNYIISEI